MRRVVEVVGLPYGIGDGARVPGAVAEREHDGGGGIEVVHPVALGLVDDETVLGLVQFEPVHGCRIVRGHGRATIGRRSSCRSLRVRASTADGTLPSGPLSG